MPGLMAYIGADARPFRDGLIDSKKAAVDYGDKTINELKKAALALEAQIEQVKRLGQSWDALGKKLSVVEGQIARAEAARTMASKTSDAERYAASVSQSGFANPRSGAAAEDAALLSQSSALKQALAQRKAMAAAADAEIAAYTTLSPAAAKYASELGAVAKMSRAAGHATFGFSNFARELMTLLRELGRGNFSRIPGSLSLLIQYAGLSTGAILGLGAAFVAVAGSIWLRGKRISELVKTLSEAKLPDLNPEFNAVRFDSVEQGWKRITKAVREAVNAYDSITAISERQLADLRQRSQEEAQLREARKNAELAAAGSDPAKRAAIEQKYEQEALAAKRKDRAEEIEKLTYEKHVLVESAQQKKQQADSIHITDEKHDADTEADLKKRADAARKDLAERQARIQKLNELQDMNRLDPRWSYLGPKFYLQYGRNTFDSARDLERRVMGRDQLAINRYNDFLARRTGRDELRKQRDELYSQAGTDAGHAAVLGRQIAAKRSEMNRANFVEAEISRLQNLARITETQREGAGGHYQLTNLQRMGAYVANPMQSSALDVARKSESHLLIIKRTLEKMAGAGRAGARVHF